MKELETVSVSPIDTSVISPTEDTQLQREIDREEAVKEASRLPLSDTDLLNYLKNTTPEAPPATQDTELEPARTAAIDIAIQKAKQKAADNATPDKSREVFLEQSKRDLESILKPLQPLSTQERERIIQAYTREFQNQLQSEVSKKQNSLQLLTENINKLIEDTLLATPAKEDPEKIIQQELTKLIDANPESEELIRNYVEKKLEATNQALADARGTLQQLITSGAPPEQAAAAIAAFCLSSPLHYAVGQQVLHGKESRLQYAWTSIQASLHPEQAVLVKELLSNRTSGEAKTLLQILEGNKKDSAFARSILLSGKTLEEYLLQQSPERLRVLSRALQQQAEITLSSLINKSQGIDSKSLFIVQFKLHNEQKETLEVLRKRVADGETELLILLASLSPVELEKLSQAHLQHYGESFDAFVGKKLEHHHEDRNKSVELTLRLYEALRTQDVEKVFTLQFLRALESEPIDKAVLFSFASLDEHSRAVLQEALETETGKKDPLADMLQENVDAGRLTSFDRDKFLALHQGKKEVLQAISVTEMLSSEPVDPAKVIQILKVIESLNPDVKKKFLETLDKALQEYAGKTLVALINRATEEERLSATLGDVLIEKITGVKPSSSSLNATKELISRSDLTERERVQYLTVYASSLTAEERQGLYRDLKNSLELLSNLSKSDRLYLLKLLATKTQADFIFVRLEQDLGRSNRTIARNVNIEEVFFALQGVPDETRKQVLHKIAEKHAKKIYVPPSVEDKDAYRLTMLIRRGNESFYADNAVGVQRCRLLLAILEGDKGINENVLAQQYLYELKQYSSNPERNSTRLKALQSHYRILLESSPQLEAHAQKIARKAEQEGKLSVYTEAMEKLALDYGVARERYGLKDKKTTALLKKLRAYRKEHNEIPGFKDCVDKNISDWIVKGRDRWTRADEAAKSLNTTLSLDLNLDFSMDILRKEENRDILPLICDAYEDRYGENYYDKFKRHTIDSTWVTESEKIYWDMFLSLYEKGEVDDAAYLASCMYGAGTWEDEIYEVYEQRDGENFLEYRERIREFELRFSKKYAHLWDCDSVLDVYRKEMNKDDRSIIWAHRNGDESQVRVAHYERKNNSFWFSDYEVKAAYDNLTDKDRQKYQSTYGKSPEQAFLDSQVLPFASMKREMIARRDGDEAQARAASTKLALDTGSNWFTVDLDMLRKNLERREEVPAEEVAAHLLRTEDIDKEKVKRLLQEHQAVKERRPFTRTEVTTLLDQVCSDTVKEKLMEEMKVLEVSSEELKAAIREELGGLTPEEYVRRYYGQQSKYLLPIVKALYENGKLDPTEEIAFMIITERYLEAEYLTRAYCTNNDDIDEQFKEKFGRDYKSYLSYMWLGGGDIKMLEVATEGEPKDALERFEHLKTLYDYEMSIWSGGLSGYFSTRDNELKEIYDKAEVAAEELKREKKKDKPNQERIAQLEASINLAYESGREAIQRYREAKAMIADVAATVAATAAVTVVTVASFGVAAPSFLAVALVAGGASLTATAGMKIAFKGSNYTYDEMMVDTAFAAIDGITAGLMVKFMPGNMMIRAGEGALVESWGALGERALLKEGQYAMTKATFEALQRNGMNWMTKGVFWAPRYLESAGLQSAITALSHTMGNELRNEFRDRSEEKKEGVPHGRGILAKETEESSPLTFPLEDSKEKLELKTSAGEKTAEEEPETKHPEAKEVEMKAETASVEKEGEKEAEKESLTERKESKDFEKEVSSAVESEASFDEPGTTEDEKREERDHETESSDEESDKDFILKPENLIREIRSIENDVAPATEHSIKRDLASREERHLHEDDSLLKRREFILMLQAHQAQQQSASKKSVEEVIIERKAPDAIQEQSVHWMHQGPSKTSPPKADTSKIDKPGDPPSGGGGGLSGGGYTTKGPGDEDTPGDGGDTKGSGKGPNPEDKKKEEEKRSEKHIRSVSRNNPVKASQLIHPQFQGVGVGAQSSQSSVTISTRQDTKIHHFSMNSSNTVATPGAHLQKDIQKGARILEKIEQNLNLSSNSEKDRLKSERESAETIDRVTNKESDLQTNKKLSSSVREVHFQTSENIHNRKSKQASSLSTEEVHMETHQRSPDAEREKHGVHQVESTSRTNQKEERIEENLLANDKDVSKTGLSFKEHLEQSEINQQHTLVSRSARTTASSRSTATLNRIASDGEAKEFSTSKNVRDPIAERENAESKVGEHRAGEQSELQESANEESVAKKAAINDREIDISEVKESKPTQTAAILAEEMVSLLGEKTLNESSQKRSQHSVFEEREEARSYHEAMQFAQEVLSSGQLTDILSSEHSIDSIRISIKETLDSILSDSPHHAKQQDSEKESTSSETQKHDSKRPDLQNHSIDDSHTDTAISTIENIRDTLIEKAHRKESLKRKRKSAKRSSKNSLALEAFLLFIQQILLDETLSDKQKKQLIAAGSLLRDAKALEQLLEAVAKQNEPQLEKRKVMYESFQEKESEATLKSRGDLLRELRIKKKLEARG